jgi:toxin YoeB
MIAFTHEAWQQYCFWEENNKKILQKINNLIKECSRTPFSGTGKPEALKNELAGFWSRRIDAEHRLVYKFENETLYIIACRYHYS